MGGSLERAAPQRRWRIYQCCAAKSCDSRCQNGRIGDKHVFSHNHHEQAMTLSNVGNCNVCTKTQDYRPDGNFTQYKPGKSTYQRISERTSADGFIPLGVSCWSYQGGSLEQSMRVWVSIIHGVQCSLSHGFEKESSWYGLGSAQFRRESISTHSPGRRSGSC